MNKREKETILAAILWWKMRAPSAYSKLDHLANPTVNCTTPSEKRLARAVAALVKVHDDPRRREEAQSE